MGGTLSRLIAGSALVGAGCVAYGTFYEAQAFVVRRYDVPVLPAGRRPLRVLHISDLHLLPCQKRKQAFLRSLAELEPDLVVNTGDNHSSPASLPVLAECLDGLLDVPGVYVFGSNDYRGPTKKTPMSYFMPGLPASSPAELDWRGLHALFQGRGWRNVMGARARFEIKGTTIEVRGCDDVHDGRDDYAKAAGPASAGVDVSCGVIHAPYTSLLDRLVRDGVDLVMAGHTHGGQVCVPFYGALVTNCDLDRKRAKGLSTWTADGRSAALEVCAGLGTSPYAPFRFACRPEVSLLTLRPRDWHAADDVR